MKNYLAQTFLKRCFVFILSSSLLYSSTLGAFASIMAFMPTNVIAADDRKENADKAQEDLCKKMEEKDSDSCKDMDKDKREAAEQMVSATDDIADANDIEESLKHSNIMSVIIMIAIVVSAVFFYISCVNQVSAVIYTLGGALYIILDAIGWSKLKSTDEYLKKNFETKKNQSAAEFNATSDSISKATDEMTAALEHINFRKTGNIIALVLFIIAFVLSILEQFIEVLTFGTKQSACYGAYGNNHNHPSDKSIDDLLLRKENAQLIAQNDIESNLLMDVFPKVRDGNYVVIDAYAKLSKSVITQEKSIIEQIDMKNVAKMAINHIIPQAKAAGSDPASGILGTIGILATIAVIVLAVIAVVDGSTKVARLTSGVGRAIVIAVFIAILAYNIHTLGAAADKLTERIEKFNKILGKINATGPDKGDLGRTNSGVGIGNNASGAITADGVPLPENAGTGNCVKTDLPNQSIASTDCGNCSGDTCADLGPEADFTNISGSIDVPGGLQSMVKDGRSGAKDLSNGRGLNKGLKNLGGQLNAVKKLMKDSQRSLNDLLKKKGQPTVNFQAEIAKSAGQLQSGISKMLAGFTQEQKAAYDNFNKGGSTKSEEEKAKEDDTFQKMLAAKNKGAVDTTPKYEMPKLNLDYKAEEATESAGNLNSADALAKYEINQNDIHNDTGPGLFEIIAVRYRKSAYPAFFKKKDPATDPVAAPAAAPAAIPAEAKK
jgi:hypothetical protein